MRLVYVALLVLFLFQHYNIYAARRSACASNEACAGQWLWWETLIDKKYTINLYSNSWPSDDSSLDSAAEFQAAIDGAFAVWESTGYVSFVKDSDSSSYDTNVPDCDAIGNQITCNGTSNCYWVTDSSYCANELDYWHGSEINLFSNVKNSSFWSGMESVVAYTSVLYDTNDGEIVEANLVINDYNYNFDLGSKVLLFNLKAILTHEIGHFLGIAHPCTIFGSGENWQLCSEVSGTYDEVTMYPLVSKNDDVKIISLESDDLLALQMVCADSKTQCHNEDEYGEVEVEQGVGCFRVDTQNRPFGDGGNFCLLLLPLIFIFILRIRLLPIRVKLK